MNMWDLSSFGSSLQEQTEQHVQPFLNLVKEMYANIKEVVEKEFGKAGTNEVRLALSM